MHGDFIAYWVPNYKYILDTVKSGHVPFWQPYSYLGLPEIFKVELVLFYPLTWLLLIFNIVFNPQIDITILGKSLEMMQYVNLLIGSMGMYMLLKKIFRINLFAAFFGGLIFTFSIYITTQLGDLSSLPGKLYLPWILFFLYYFLQSSSPKRYTLLVLVNYTILSFGYPYNYVYFFIVELSFALFFGFKKTLLVCIALVNSILLAGYFLLPNLHVLSQSSRGMASNVVDPLFHLRNAFIPTKLVNIFNPQVFANLYDKNDPNLLFSMGGLGWGVIPLIFLVIGFASFKKGHLNIWVILTFLFGIIISFGGYLNVPGFLGILLPFLDKFRSHAQALSLTFFTGVILISIGIDSVINGYKNNKILFFLWQVAALLVVFLLLMPFSCKDCGPGLHDAGVSYARSTALLVIGLILVSIYMRIRSRILIICCVFITLFEFSLYANSVPFLRMPTSYGSYYEPNRLIVEYPSNDNMFRYIFAENQYIYNTSFLKVFNREGYETVPSSSYNALVRFGQSKTLQFTNTKYFITPTTPEQNIKNGLDVLSFVKKIDPSDHPNETYYGSVDGLPYLSLQKKYPYYVYKINDYYARFFVPERVLPCEAESCFSKDDPKVKSFAKNLDSNVFNQDASAVRIVIQEYLSDKIKLSVDTKRKTFITSSEIWDKGWSLSINGNHSRLYDTNGGFRGFIAPPGRSTILMNYSPPYFLEGLFVTLVGILIILIIHGKIKILQTISSKITAAVSR